MIFQDKIPDKFSEKKILIPILVSLLGLIGFTIISTSAEFKNTLLSYLYPKSKSYAQDQQLKDSISNLTKELASAQQNLTAAIPAISSPFTIGQPRVIRVAMMDNIATERKNLILQALESDPSILFQNRIPQSVRDAMPDLVKEDVETDMQKQGATIILHKDDFSSEKGSNEYYLKDQQMPATQHYTTSDLPKIYFTAQPINLNSGDSLSIKGLVIGNVNVVDTKTSGNLTVTPLSVLPTLSTSSPSVTLDPQRSVAVLALIAQFQDSSSAPLTINGLTDILSGTNSVKSFYVNASTNYFSPLFTVRGTYILPYSTPTTCVMDRLVFDTVELAHNSGVSTESYNYYMVILPNLTACRYGGSATLGYYISPVDSYSYLSRYPHLIHMNGPGNLSAIEHELGHTIGMNHGAFATCGIRGIIDTCGISEYGDLADVMGNTSGSRGINAAHRMQMGWIPSTQYLFVSSNTTQTIKPLNSTPGIRIIAINNLRSGFYPSDSRITYYLSYRQKTGIDADIPSLLADGISIHVGEAPQPLPAIRNPYRVYDYTFQLTPQSGLGPLNAVLSDNMTYTDLANGIQIRQISHNSTGATVQITFTTLSPSPIPTSSAGITSWSTGSEIRLDGEINIDNTDLSI